MSKHVAVKHTLWTALDELGLIVGLERLPDETNQSYIDRLQMRMKWPPSSSVQGLTNALSIEFGKEPYHTDDKNTFILTHPPLNVDHTYLSGAVVDDKSGEHTIEVTVDSSTSVDGNVLVQYIEVDPSTPPGGWKIPNNVSKLTDNSDSLPGFIIWRNDLGEYTTVLEFINYTPPTGSQVRVEYMYLDEEGNKSFWADFSIPGKFSDTRFIGQKAYEPKASTQIRVLSVDDLPDFPE
jgi:hypothetical protein